MFRIICPCATTACSVLVDNFTRDPFSRDVDQDLQLLQEVRQLIQNIVDNTLFQPLLGPLNDLERLALATLKKQPTRTLPQLTEGGYLEPSTSSSMLYQGDFHNSPQFFDTSFSPPFQLPMSTSIRNPPFPAPSSVGQTYPAISEHYQYQQFPSAESSSAMAALQRPITSSPSLVSPHQQAIQSQVQGTTSQWPPGSISELPPPAMQISQQLSQSVLQQSTAKSNFPERVPRVNGIPLPLLFNLNQLGLTEGDIRDSQAVGVIAVDRDLID